MKSPFLILFITFNLLAINMVSAANMYDEKMTQSHWLQTQDDSSRGDCADEAACNHFCHINAHIVGLITPSVSLPGNPTSLSYLILDEHFRSLTISPPFQPPKA